MAKIKRITERAADGTIISEQHFLAPARPSLPSLSSVQSPGLPPPTIPELLTNFGAAMLRWAGSGFAVVDEVAFRLRLEQCRACRFWDEHARAGAGKCQHPKCGCTKAKLWLASEKCPIARW